MILFRKYTPCFPQFKGPSSYEDLTANIYNATPRMFDFLGLDFNRNVKKYLEEHTKSKSRFGAHSSSSSTCRDTQTENFKWLKDLEGNFSVVEYIQNTCREAIRFWGYEFMTLNGFTE